MNREETIALYKQRESGAWGAWVQEMMARRKEFADQNVWPFGANPPRDNSQIDNWMDEASVDFSKFEEFGHTFFSGREFPWNANFSNIVASGNGFSNLVFHGEANFDGARFPRGVKFSGTKFSRDTSFNMAEFSGVTDFSGCEFREDVSIDNASFEQCRFSSVNVNGSANFRSCRFQENSSFDGMTASKELIVSEAVFTKEADFRAMHIGGDFKADGVNFRSFVYFDDTVFEGNFHSETGGFVGETSFNNCSFNGGFQVAKSHFANLTTFYRSSFHSVVNFNKVFFQGTAEFGGSTFGGYVDFGTTRFMGDVGLRDVTFVGMINFQGASFERTVDVRGCEFGEVIGLDQTILDDFFGNQTTKEPTGMARPPSWGDVVRDSERVDRVGNQSQGSKSINLSGEARLIGNLKGHHVCFSSIAIGGELSGVTAVFVPYRGNFGTSPNEFAEVLGWPNAIVLGDGERALGQCVDILRKDLEWLRYPSDEIADFLQQLVEEPWITVSASPLDSIGLGAKVIIGAVCSASRRVMAILISGGVIFLAISAPLLSFKPTHDAVAGAYREWTGIIDDEEFGAEVVRDIQHRNDELSTAVMRFMRRGPPSVSIAIPRADGED